MAILGKKIPFYLLVVSLIITPIIGCARNIPPTANFVYSPLTPTAVDDVLFTDDSTDDDGDIVSWTWDFGDGNTSVEQNPSHSFRNPGTYIVELTVTDDDGADGNEIVTITVALPPAEIGKDEAIAILVSKIMEPASSGKRVSAFMLSQPLQKGDVVNSESGGKYPINANTWFIFVDDAPEAFFAHATRYVFIDARTASYDIVDETWPPQINNVSMWDTGSLNRGHLIELYSILDNAAPISGGKGEAPSGDYGDAPDGQNAYYAVQGCFPTLFNTTNSKFSRPGGHTLNTGEETLGLSVSAEVDANDPKDPDGVPNLVDADSDERMYVILEGKKAKLAFTVAVSSEAPDVTRYANALIDFDQNGKWSAGSYGIEWVVVNLAVNVAPGSSEVVITPWFSWGNQVLLSSPAWMRVSLTRRKVDESLFSNVGGWDGSGQFEYGEIEDRFVFLMDRPPLPGFVRYWPPMPGQPPGGDGQPPGGGGGGGQPPGPEKGPCGYDINYYVITISGGDNSKDLAKGTPVVGASVDSMVDVAEEQGYTSMGNLGPGNNSLEDIGSAFDQLAAGVKCGDYVLIYICGHGKESGGIALKDGSGKTQEVLKPTDGDSEDNSMEDLLAKIPSCPDEECTEAGGCCHVSVIIESCFAGNFDVPGVTGEGRAVVGTSTDTESWATYPGGGVYTGGLVEDLRDDEADKSTPPDGVDPMEANESAKDKVNEHNKKQGKSQKPWDDNQWCECKCPCKPGIDVDKWVLDVASEEWVNEIDASPGQLVRFRLDIENDGKCRDIVDLEVVDFLPGCLDYAGGATIYYNGSEHEARPPDAIVEGGAGTQLFWDLEEIEALSPGESIAIEYDAVAEEQGENINLVFGSAHCAYDYSVVVSDEDIATVVVASPTEEVLHVAFEASAESILDGFGCHSSLSISFEGLDLTGGAHLVTNVVLIVNGEVWHDSGSISTVFYQSSVEWQAGCGEAFDIEVMATNESGQLANSTGSITTPLPQF